MQNEICEKLDRMENNLKREPEFQKIHDDVFTSDTTDLPPIGNFYIYRMSHTLKKFPSRLGINIDILLTSKPGLDLIYIFRIQSSLSDWSKYRPQKVVPVKGTSLYFLLKSYIDNIIL